MSAGGTPAQRLDLVLQMPQKSVGDRSNGAEILSHTFKIFPIDSLWCSEGLHDYYRSQFWAPGTLPSSKSITWPRSHKRLASSANG